MAVTFVLEAHPRGATLYVPGRLTAADLPAMRIACSLLPASVRSLRIDGGAAADLDRATRRVLKHAAAYWRRTRGGEVSRARGVRGGPRAAQRSAATSATPVPISPAMAESTSTARLRVSAATAPSAMATCRSATASA